MFVEESAARKRDTEHACPAGRVRQLTKDLHASTISLTAAPAQGLATDPQRAGEMGRYVAASPPAFALSRKLATRVVMKPQLDRLAVPSIRDEVFSRFRARCGGCRQRPR